MVVLTHNPTAILAHSAAVFAVVRGGSGRARRRAGLGEYSAYVTAGSVRP
jgi:hypothetical protein